MSDNVQVALIGGVVTVVVAVINNWSKLSKSKERSASQAEPGFRYRWPILGGLVAVVVTYGVQNRAGVVALVNPGVVTKCDYQFADPRPSASISNKVNDGMFWYSSKSECTRLDPLHRQIVIESNGSETSKTFLDNYAEGSTQDRGDGRRYYSVIFHMPANNTGLSRYAEFYWPGGGQPLRVTQQP